ncbi:pleiotropic drug resistance protein 1 [Prunus yedoensis var. nudiflora]|uniref:Pleiotropic drug resistance protein 1 n=1 Tax=Prunus yedoensis var. nudiflora TaxID=2094558 RepID=A0A314YDD9_PRUYE|nr:pleiotropic drug resistance protein 1 [Prunus yedoensis var. nudiflora]
MLEVASAAQEAALGVNFADIYKNSEMYRQRQRDLLQAMGSMYAAVLFIGIQNSLSVQPVVGTERMVFYRERAAGMYSAFPFAFGQAVIEIPYTLIQTIIYGVLVYSMVGFHWTVSKFFWYLFFMFSPSYTYLPWHDDRGHYSNNTISAVVSSAFFPLWNVISDLSFPKQEFQYGGDGSIG